MNYIETHRGDRRYTGVTVEMLDLEKLASIFRNHPDDAIRSTRNGFTADSFMQTGIILNNEGFLRTINDEGVSDRGMTGDEFTDTFAVYTFFGYIEFTRAQIESALLGETVDLSSLIRVFGDRLERNFRLAYNWATGDGTGR